MRSAFPAKVRNAGRIRVWLAGAERTLAARSPLLDLVRADAVTRIGPRATRRHARASPAYPKIKTVACHRRGPSAPVWARRASTTVLSTSTVAKLGALRSGSARDALHEVDDLVRVAPLVVVPGDDFDEGLVERDARFGVEHGGVDLTHEVGRNDLFVGVAEDALHLAFGGGLHGLADVVVAGFFVELDGEVDHGHVRGRHAEGHAGELAVELRNHLAHGLGRAGRRRDDVLEDAAATAPILLRGTVDRLLRGGRGVHGGHQAALDAPVVVQHLGHGRETVGGAGSVRDDRLASVAVVVHADHEHRCVVFARSREHDLLRASGQVLLAARLVEEDTGGFDDGGSAHGAPVELRRIGLSGAADRLAVDDELAVRNFDTALEAAVHRVVLQHVCEVLDLEQIVDRDDLDIATANGSAKNHATDAAEAIDTDLDHIFRSFSRRPQGGSRDAHP